MTTKIVSDIITSKTKVTVTCDIKTVTDALNYGFSYIEHEDHIVEYIVANSKIMKKIFSLEDSKLSPHGESIGTLWTAKLLLSNKLNDKQIAFSNSNFSVVLNLDLDPYN